jgi:cell wall assembly regulator SMI1
MGFPWRTGQSVPAVVDAHKTILVEAGIIDPGPGCDVTSIRAVEDRIGCPMPDDVREFYCAGHPHLPGQHEAPGVTFFQLDDPDVRWYRLARDRPHPLDFEFYGRLLGGWDAAEGFMLGGDSSFDRLFWIRNAPGQPDGVLLFTAWQDERIHLPIVARSLAEYLGRIAYLLSLDRAARKWDAADIVRNPPEYMRLVAQEFAELNSTATYKDAAEFALREEEAFQEW